MLRLCLIAATITLSCTSTTPDCVQRNISCADIQTADGFEFRYQIPLADVAEISVYDNETLIAHSKPSKQEVDHLPQVVSMNNDSVVTRDCRGLKVEYLLNNGPYVTDRCEIFSIQEGKLTTSPTQQTTVIVAVVVPAAVLCIAMLAVWLYYKRCKKSKADRTPQTPLLDHNLNNVAIQPSKNGDSSAPDVNGASDHRAMDRNAREDPGGANNTGGQHAAWSSERQGPQTRVNDGQRQELLLSNERVAVQGFDVTGEAVPLVINGGFDPDLVNRRSVSPDTDVESQHEEP